MFIHKTLKCFTLKLKTVPRGILWSISSGLVQGDDDNIEPSPRVPASSLRDSSLRDSSLCDRFALHVWWDASLKVKDGTAKHFEPIQDLFDCHHVWKYHRRLFQRVLRNFHQVRRLCGLLMGWRLIPNRSCWALNTSIACKGASVVEDSTMYRQVWSCWNRSKFIKMILVVIINKIFLTLRTRNSYFMNYFYFRAIKNIIENLKLTYVGHQSSSGPQTY